MHHIGLYVWVGWSFGADNGELEKWLERTGDLDDDGKVKNGNYGDYRLGVLGGDIGRWLQKNPGYKGGHVTSMLKTHFKTACQKNGRNSFPGKYTYDTDPDISKE